MRQDGKILYAKEATKYYKLVFNILCMMAIIMCWHINTHFTRIAASRLMRSN